MTTPILPLDPFLYRDQYWCANCGGKQEFIPLWETEFGHVGFCWGCGERKFRQFSRTTECAA